jgi:flagellar biosynthesis protein FlhG
MRVLAVTSGKGGVGKTNLSANLAIALSMRGERVTVFDADIGLANLDVVLGVPAKGTLQQVVSGEKKLMELLADGPGGIKFLGGGSGIETMLNLSGRAGDAFIAELRTLETSTDFLVFDTGAGIDANVMTFLAAADEVLVVVTPDPASMTDGYATIKAILGRNPETKMRVVMNLVDDEAQGKAVFARLSSIAQQFLGAPLVYAGFVRTDPRAAAAVRKRKPWMIDPTMPASQDVNRVAGWLLGDRMAPYVDSTTTISFADRLRGLFNRAA